MKYNSLLVLVISMSMEKSTIDLQLHMAVKSLAIFQGEINCKIDELIKKTKILQEKEEEGEKNRLFFENSFRQFG